MSDHDDKDDIAAANEDGDKINNDYVLNTSDIWAWIKTIRIFKTHMHIRPKHSEGRHSSISWHSTVLDIHDI